MVENILESLCGDVDAQILAGKEVDSELLLKEHNLYDDPLKNTYYGFIEKYKIFAFSTLNEIKTVKMNLDSVKKSISTDISLYRVSMSALWGTILFANILALQNAFVAAGAASAAGLAIYDERSKKGMSLSRIGWGIFFGNAIGDMIDPANPHYFRYLGAFCGGAIALVSEYAKKPSPLKTKKKKIAELNNRLKIQEQYHENNKTKLMDSTLDRIISNVDDRLCLSE